MSRHPKPTPPETGFPPQEAQQHPAAGYGGMVPPYPADGNALGEAPAPRRSRALPWAVAALLFAGVLVYARFGLFTVRDLRVTGIKYVPLDMVKRTLGMDRNLFYLTLTEDYVRRAVNANRYLQFISMEKIPPSSLLLRVKERWPLAFLTHLGMGYVLAQDATVLEQSRDLSKGSPLIAVYGLTVWGHLAPGAAPQASDPDQVPRLRSILAALTEWGFDAQVQSVDVGQQMALSLMTYDGYLVNLGDASNMGAKIGTAQAVVAELRRMGMGGGILECSRPGEASYRASAP